MNTFPVSRLALALAFGVTLTTCSSTPLDQCPSDQTAPSASSRPVLSAKEAQDSDAQHYFASLTPGATAWNPSPITLPAQLDFIVNPVNTQGVTYTTIQTAIDAAIIECTNKRQYIAVMPGEYQGTVYVPATPGGTALYGTDRKPIGMKIRLSLNDGMNPADQRHGVNPHGKYIPGKPAWCMYDSCQNRRNNGIDVLCSAVFWSQNNGLQLQNLTIENALGDGINAGNHPAVALRIDGDQVQINSANVFGRQNTSFVTSSSMRSRLETDRQPRMLVTNSYIEEDMNIVSGRGATMFDNTELRVANSRTQQEAYVLTPATLSNAYCGSLTVNSRFSAFGDGVAQLGRSLDVDANTSGQVVIRDSTISEGFNTAKPWADAVVSNCPLTGNTGNVDDDDEIQRDLSDTNYNRIWGCNNHGVGSKVVAEARK